MSQASSMTLKAYPFPENFMCILGLHETIYGVAAVDESSIWQGIIQRESFLEIRLVLKEEGCKSCTNLY